MLNMFEVNETNKMIEQELLDVRTITMGISLLDCSDSDLKTVNEKKFITKLQPLQKILWQLVRRLKRILEFPL